MKRIDPIEEPKAQPGLGPKPTKRDGRWQAQILLTEATMARQLAHVLARGDDQLSTWLAAMGSRFEAVDAFTIFDEELNMMVVRFAFAKKPRTAIAKALAKIDESDQVGGVIHLATGSA